MVIYEDGAALAGLVVAGIGVFIGNHFDLPVVDGIASIVIGLILAFVAVLVTLERRGLLVGESMQAYEVDDIERLVKQEKNVERLKRPLTMHMGPKDVLLALDVQFNHNLNNADLLETISRIEDVIRESYPEIKQIYIEAAKGGRLN